MHRDRTLLSTQEIRTTAELAHLLVSDCEVAQLRGELAAVLDYAAQLGAIDVSGVPPMTHAVTLPCPLRAEVVGTHDPLAATLRNAPASDGAFFVVPAVLAHRANADSQDEGAS